MAATSAYFSAEEKREAHIGMWLFWIAILLFPLTLIAAGVLYGLLYGFSARKLKVAAVGAAVLLLDVAGVIGSFDHRLWLIALVPHAAVPISVGWFCLEIMYLNWQDRRAAEGVQELEKK